MDPLGDLGYKEQRVAATQSHDATLVVPQKHGMVEAKPGSGGAPQEVA